MNNKQLDEQNIEDANEDVVILVNKILAKAGISDEVQTITRLGKGGFADCFKLAMRNGGLVLKIRRDDQGHRLKREFNLLSHRLLVGHELAPKVLDYDDSGKLIPYTYLLEELVEGTNPIEGELQEGFLLAAAKWYRELHGLTSDRLEEVEDEELGKQRINSLMLWFKRDQERVLLSEQNGKLRGDVLLAVKFVMEKLQVLFSQYDGIFSRKVYNFTHGDPAAENIFIQSDGSLKMIDWDFAGFHIFETDLAMFAYTWELTADQEKRFLADYGLEITEETLRKFYLMQLKLLTGDIVGWLPAVDEDYEGPIMAKVEKMKEVLVRMGS